MEYNSQHMTVPDRVIRMELISFFIRYPNAPGSLEEISEHLGRNRKQVERQLEELAHLRILRREYIDERPCYRYVPAKAPDQNKRTSRKKTIKVRLPGYLKSRSKPGFETTKQERDDRSEAMKTSVRLQILIAAQRMKGWREFVELLLDSINHVVGVTCSAYLLRKKCSEVVWNCLRGADIAGSQILVNGQGQIVIEGELIRNKGLLDTAHYIKYLHPYDDNEALMICVFREGGSCIDIDFLKSLFIDFVPVAVEKRRSSMKAERAAEKTLQESIYWATICDPDIRKGGMDYILASLAKCTGASRISLLMYDGDTSLQTLTVYGVRKNMALPAGSFPIGKGVAGWCVENVKAANIIYAREDPRYIPNYYNDIETMLCCPMMLPGGKVFGALCAVNKEGSRTSNIAAFDLEDMSFLEETANSIAKALSVRKHRESRFSQAQSPKDTSSSN